MGPREQPLLGHGGITHNQGEDPRTEPWGAREDVGVSSPHLGLFPTHAGVLYWAWCNQEVSGYTKATRCCWPRQDRPRVSPGPEQWGPGIADSWYPQEHQAPLWGQPRTPMELPATSFPELSHTQAAGTHTLAAIFLAR